LRWGVEVAYFRLKQELSIEKFSGKTPNAVRQDFWATMVLMNAVTVFRHEADQEIKGRQKHKDTLHQNQTRVSDLIITLRDSSFWQPLIKHRPSTKMKCQSLSAPSPEAYHRYDRADTLSENQGHLMRRIII